MIKILIKCDNCENQFTIEEERVNDNNVICSECKTDLDIN